MQQSFDLQNKSSFKQQISDPNLGMGGKSDPEFKAMNSVQGAFLPQDNSLIGVSGFLSNNNNMLGGPLLTKRQSSRRNATNDITSKGIDTSLSVLFGGGGNR